MLCDKYHEKYYRLSFALCQRILSSLDIRVIIFNFYLNHRNVVGTKLQVKRCRHKSGLFLALIFSFSIYYPYAKNYLELSMMYKVKLRMLVTLGDSPAILFIKNTIMINASKTMIRRKILTLRPVYLFLFFE